MSVLQKLYEEMAELTLPECKQCRVPLSCCSAEYCEMAKEYALERFEIELKPTDHPSLPFMTPTGCSVPPYLRPLCTLHTCRINSIGSSGNVDWDRRYFELREKIETGENL